MTFTLGRASRRAVQFPPRTVLQQENDIVVHGTLRISLTIANPTKFVGRRQTPEVLTRLVFDGSLEVILEYDGAFLYYLNIVD